MMIEVKKGLISIIGLGFIEGNYQNVGNRLRIDGEIEIRGIIWG